MAKKEIYILIIVILIAILIVGFLIWSNHNKTIERKFQDCSDKCRADHIGGFFDDLKEVESCLFGCKEKYGK